MQPEEAEQTRSEEEAAQKAVVEETLRKQFPWSMKEEAAQKAVAEEAERRRLLSEVREAESGPQADLFAMIKRAVESANSESRRELKEVLSESEGSSGDCWEPSHSCRFT